MRRRRVSTGFLFVAITLFVSNNYYEDMKNDLQSITAEQARRTHFTITTKFMEGRENWTTSILGSWLFKFGTYKVAQKNKTFIVHVSRYRPSKISVLQDCTVTNCIFTGDDSLLPTVDAVLVYLQRGIIPKVKHRSPHQRWIFSNDEAPKNAFSLSTRKVHLKELTNIFNWSMTYRSDADIPKPYGRTVPLDEPVFKNFDMSALMEIIPNWTRKRRDVLAIIVMSNCIYYRMNFIKTLQKHIPVDIIGGCARDRNLKYRCPGHFRRDCDPMSEYLFYLALENSDCREYLTEKVWYNAYEKGAIPVIMGPSLADCQRLLPPNSYLYISKAYKDAEIEELAQNMIRLSEDDDLFFSFHQWRNHFRVINEHGFFGRKSVALCRLCEGLNYNDGTEKIYGEEDIRYFLDHNLLCGKNNV